MWTQSCLSVSGEVSKEPGQAQRMLLVSKVKSMSCINALCAINYIIKGIREMLMPLHLI